MVHHFNKILFALTTLFLFSCQNTGKDDITAINELSPEYPTVDLIVEEITKMKFNKTKKNFFYFFMYLMKEAYLLYNKRNLNNLFRPFKKKDRDLFKKFSL